MNEAIRLWELKKRVIDELKRILPGESVKRASRDGHARRKPRPCGITIHPAQGCPFGCAYCYLPGMGFGNDAICYKLSPEELALALAMNPHVVPERTFAAFGSVTEPLLPKVRDVTLGYLNAVSRWLRLPSQISTKLVITPELAKDLASREPSLSVLITVTTKSKHRALEPKAPPPEERIRGGGNAAKEGLRIDLFMRPLIPGAISKEDAEAVLTMAADHSFSGVVTGSLRVTKGIVADLAKAGISVEEIMSRLHTQLKPRRQVPIDVSDLKNMVRKIALQKGLQVLPSACAANALSHGVRCWMCGHGPCGGLPGLPEESEVTEFIEYLGGVVARVSRSGQGLLVTLRRSPRLARSDPDLSTFLTEVYRVRVKLVIRD